MGKVERRKVEGEGGKKRGEQWRSHSRACGAHFPPTCLGALATLLAIHAVAGYIIVSSWASAKFMSCTTTEDVF